MSKSVAAARNAKSVRGVCSLTHSLAAAIAQAAVAAHGTGELSAGKFCAKISASKRAFTTLNLSPQLMRSQRRNQASEERPKRSPAMNVDILKNCNPTKSRALNASAASPQSAIVNDMHISAQVTRNVPPKTESPKADMEYVAVSLTAAKDTDGRRPCEMSDSTFKKIPAKKGVQKGWQL